MQGMPVNISGEEVKAHLKKASVLTAGLSESELEELTRIAVPMEYPEGSLILQEDETSRDCYIVARGAVSVELKLSPSDSTAMSIHKIRDGGLAGEFSFIDGSRRSANIKVLHKSLVLRLNHDSLENLCTANNRLGYVIMKNMAVLMAQRLRSTNFELRSHMYL